VLMFQEAGDVFKAAQTLERRGIRDASYGRRLSARGSLRRALALYTELGSEHAASVRSAIEVLDGTTPREVAPPNGRQPTGVRIAASRPGRRRPSWAGA
jgi:hypothetical protein